MINRGRNWCRSPEESWALIHSANSRGTLGITAARRVPSILSHRSEAERVPVFASAAAGAYSVSTEKQGEETGPGAGPIL